jgi:hypothetical protein
VPEHVLTVTELANCKIIEHFAIRMHTSFCTVHDRGGVQLHAWRRFPTAGAFELLDITPSNRSQYKKAREITLIIGVGQACVTTLACKRKGTENQFSVPFSRLARRRQNRASDQGRSRTPINAGSTKSRTVT